MLTAIEVPYDSEEEWLALRRRGLGASDVAAAFGLSPYASPYSVWAEKVGAIPDREPSEQMRWGHRLEGVILDEWSERTGLVTVARASMWKHPVFDWALCTVDALAAPRPRNVVDRIVEVKTSFSAWDEIPDHYKLQANWQMFVTGLIEVPAEIILLPANKHLKTYTHEYDEGLADAALEAATRFWGWVQDHRPPPIDGHAATASTLAGLHPADRAGGEVEVDLPVASAVVELRSLKGRLENLTNEKARLENIIKAALGDATEAYYKGDVIATWRSQHRKESIIKASDFRVLRLRGGPE